MALGPKPRGIVFDDWEIDKEYWGFERTITETDFVTMCYLSGDDVRGPIYEDDGKGNKVCYVHGSLTYIISQGLVTATCVFDGTYIAFLGGNMKFGEPVLIGDTIKAVLIPREKRESKSRPGMGVVKFETITYNQRDEVVCVAESSFLIAKSLQIAEDNRLVTL